MSNSSQYRRRASSPAETEANTRMAKELRRDRCRREIAAVKRMTGLSAEEKTERIEALLTEMRRP